MVLLLTRAAAISCKQVKPAPLRRACYICMNMLPLPQRLCLKAKWSWAAAMERATDALDHPELRMGHQCHPWKAELFPAHRFPAPTPTEKTHSKSIGFLYQPKKMTFAEPLSRPELFILIVSEMKQQKTSHVNSSVSC